MINVHAAQYACCYWLPTKFYPLPGYPKRLLELTMHADKAVSSKAMAAMMKQKKIDIAEIEAAVRGWKPADAFAIMLDDATKPT